MEGLEDDERGALVRLQEGGRDIEHVLSRLRRIAALLDGGTDQIDGLTGDQANNLDRAICQRIVAALNVNESDPAAPMLHFASWLARADYHLPVEVFTVNYDLGLETALESLSVPYFDGFVGSLRARFRIDLVEANAGDADNWLPSFLVRLWKLHGSVNWQGNSGVGAGVLRLGSAVDSGSVAAIYPSDTKYDESRRVPFVVLQDRFRRALNQPETLTLISGYSFGDNHLNEIIFDAARRRPRSDYTVFCYQEIPKLLTETALMTPNLQVVGRKEAILGGTKAEWKIPGNNETPAGVWSRESEEAYGGLALVDFAKLAAFLARSAPPQGELDARLKELLDESH